MVLYGSDFEEISFIRFFSKYQKGATSLGSARMKQSVLRFGQSALQDSITKHHAEYWLSKDVLHQSHLVKKRSFTRIPTYQPGRRNKGDKKTEKINRV